MPANAVSKEAQAAEQDDKQSMMTTFLAILPKSPNLCVLANTFSCQSKQLFLLAAPRNKFANHCIIQKRSERSGLQRSI